ncbi:MAG: glutathione peroxidase, partial [Marinilabiliales bacterium]
MNKLLIIVSILFSAYFTNAQSTIYEFTVEDIDGNEYSLSQLEGKKVMIVNVASKCGFTPQYEKLEEIYQTYKDKNF